MTRRPDVVTADARCKVCRSPARVEIDKRLLAGDSERSLEKRLKAQGTDIGRESLRNHNKRHLGVQVKLAARAQASEQLVDQQVQKIEAKAELLDDMASMAVEVARSLHPSMVKQPAQPGQLEAKRPGQVDAMLYEGMIREVRQIVKTKHELLHGKDVNINGLGLIEFLAKFGGGAGEGQESEEPVAALPGPVLP